MSRAKQTLLDLLDRATWRLEQKYRARRYSRTAAARPSNQEMRDIEAWLLALRGDDEPGN